MYVSEEEMLINFYKEQKEKAEEEYYFIKSDFFKLCQNLGKVLASVEKDSSSAVNLKKILGVSNVEISSENNAVKLQYRTEEICECKSKDEEMTLKWFEKKGYVNYPFFVGWKKIVGVALLSWQVKLVYGKIYSGL